MLKEYNFSKEFLENINSLGYQQLTKIQSLSLPLSLKNKDLIAQAKTGSGKTVAFSIPLVEKLDVKKYKIQSLVLAPTRELSNQIASEIRKLSRHIHNVKVLSLCGGTPFKPQVASIEHGAHIIVGTPGRILQHIHETKIDFDNVNTLVLDEADKMLDMGFHDDIIKIIDSLPKQRQTLLFSATYEENIENLSKEILNNPKFVKTDDVHEKDIINQTFYEVESRFKTSLIPNLILQNNAKSILIFCNTKVKCEELADELHSYGIDVLTLHSNLEQRDRDETLILFSNNSYPILIATDVASRGLHIDDINLVINYDIPRDESVYTHRIGRTARAGKNGLAVTLFEKDEFFKVEPIKEKFEEIKFEDFKDIKTFEDYKIDSEFRSLIIIGGKKQKLRAGDILGALTAGIGLNKEDIGKINILDFVSYVAIKKEVLKKALNGLTKEKSKTKALKFLKSKYDKISSLTLKKDIFNMATATARHLLVESEELCNELKQRIAKGEDFGALAQEFSQCPSGANGGDLGKFSQGQMVPEFDTVVFNEAVNVVHGPVKTDFGYHLLETTSRED